MQKIDAFATLPDDIITNILLRAAASPIRDLGSVKLTCKKFLEVSEEAYFYRQISVRGLPVDDYGGHFSRFLEKCRQNENPDALYRDAVRDYIDGRDPETAFQCLEKCSATGHEESSYALGIILLLRGKESKKKGILFLGGLKARIQKRIAKNYRAYLLDVMRLTWGNNETVLRQRGITCCTSNHRRSKTLNTAWEYETDDEDDSCYGCSCDNELDAVFDQLPRRTFD